MKRYLRLALWLYALAAVGILAVLIAVLAAALMYVIPRVLRRKK